MPDFPTKPFSGIFVSYRRDDCSGHAGRLFDRLVEHFGADQIFMDVANIGPGEDFIQVIENELDSCAVLIVMIGRQWLAVGEASKWFDNPNDFVRFEVGTALDRNISVIPVLVQGAKMPEVSQLPEAIAKLSRRNSITLNDPSWPRDVAQLIVKLENIIASRHRVRTDGPGKAREARSAQPHPSSWFRPKGNLILLAGIVFIAMIALIISGRLGLPEPQDNDNTPSSSPTVQPSPTSLSAAENAARGFDLISQAKYADAEPYFREAVNQSPFAADYENGLGLALFFQQRYVDAEPHLRKAVKFLPDHPQFNADLGTVLAKQGKYEEATPYHANAWRLRPNQAAFVNHFGIDLYFQQKYAEAENAFRDAVRLDPDDAGYQHDLGNALYKQKKFAAAEAPYRQAVQLTPKNAGFQYDLGNVLYALGKYDEAKDCLLEAVRLEPANQAYQADLKKIPVK